MTILNNSEAVKGFREVLATVGDVPVYLGKRIINTSAALRKVEEMGHKQTLVMFPRKTRETIFEGETIKVVRHKIIG